MKDKINTIEGFIKKLKSLPKKQATEILMQQVGRLIKKSNELEVAGSKKIEVGIKNGIKDLDKAYRFYSGLCILLQKDPHMLYGFCDKLVIYKKIETKAFHLKRNKEEWEKLIKR